MPREISAVCTLFLGRYGSILCEIIGGRRYSDLPQGGLEIPRRLIFRVPAKFIAKVQKLLQLARNSSMNTWCTEKESPEQQSSSMYPEKKIEVKADISNPCDKTWIVLDGLQLPHFYMEVLWDGRTLNDNHINLAQSLLKYQFPCLDG